MYKKIVMLLEIMLCMFVGSGCAMENPTFYDWSEEKQQTYVKEYIKAEYGLEGELYEIDYLSGWGYDDILTTLFTLPDGREFRLWIGEDGTITDLKFQWELQDEMDEMIHDKFEDIAGENAVYNDFSILSYPKKIWKEDDDLWQMLEEEHMWHAIYVVFPRELTEEELNKIKSEFEGLDVLISIFYREHALDECNFEELMVTECEETINIYKGGEK